MNPAYRRPDRSRARLPKSTGIFRGTAAAERSLNGTTKAATCLKIRGSKANIIDKAT
jgi:hypothetical protein